MPVNVILMPMEGDPMAPSAFWALTRDARHVPEAGEGLAMSRRDARATSSVFSMSFLDTICCAFGAVILLFVLSKFGEPQAHEKAREDLSGRVLALQKEFEEIRGTTEVLNREPRRASGDVRRRAEGRPPAWRAQRLRGKYRSSKQESDVQNELEGQLVAAQEQLTAECRSVSSQITPSAEHAVAGIPVDSEYIIFIIDTSGSMVNRLAADAAQDAGNPGHLPEGQGLAGHERRGHIHVPVLSRANWLPDTPVQRKRVMDRLRDWNAFSSSTR